MELARNIKWVTAAIALAAVVLFCGGVAISEEKPKPVQVFILAGQSNMEGKGAVNTLDHIGDDAEHGHLLAKIKNEDGSWVVRDDVFIDYLGRSGPLTVGYGSKGGPHGGKIGPELGFGVVVGDAIEAPVLLIKTAWGGKDVAKDFLPPSLGGPGEFWTKMMDNVQRVLGNIDSVVPDYNNRGYEIAGFVWFQGWNDMVNKEKTAQWQFPRRSRSRYRSSSLPDSRTWRAKARSTPSTTSATTPSTAIFSPRSRTRTARGWSVTMSSSIISDAAAR